MTSWLYFAAPLFTQAEIVFNQSLAKPTRGGGLCGLFATAAMCANDRSH